MYTQQTTIGTAKIEVEQFDSLSEMGDRLTDGIAPINKARAATIFKEAKWVGRRFKNFQEVAKACVDTWDEGERAVDAMERAPPASVATAAPRESLGRRLPATIARNDCNARTNRNLRKRGATPARDRFAGMTYDEVRGITDFDELFRIYCDYGDYDLGGGAIDVARARVFIAAGRRLPSLVETDKQGERLRFDPTIEAARIQQAVEQYHMAMNAAQVSQIRFADTSHFRD